MNSLVVVSSDIKNGALSEALYTLIIKKGIPSGMLLDCKFYDEEAQKQNRIKKIRKVIITGVLIVIGLALSLYLNNSIITGVIDFLFAMLWN